MTNDELLSRTISWLRFPLIVGVVFIHNNISTIRFQGVEYEFDNPDWYYAVINFFSEVLPRIAVPLFFFISGFLFFYRVSFDRPTYRRKLKSRIRTLLIPYLIWNLVGFLLFSFKHLPVFAHILPGIHAYPYNWQTFFDSFWAISIDPEKAATMPINYPFWFIRDLMIVVVFTPVLHWLISHARLVPVLLLGLCWYFNLWFGIPGLSIAAWFFFTLGAYFSINQVNVVTALAKRSWIPWLYLVVAVADVLTKGEVYNGYIHRAGLLVGIASCFVLVACGLKSSRLRVNRFLSDGSFFVFATHSLIIGYVTKGAYFLLRPTSPYVLILLYFLSPILTIALCLWAYHLLRRFLPKVGALVTGGR